jgi:hypothetical protein
MNLVCPHCAKVVEIAPELAGKTTTCPKCAGPFTVPLVPPDMMSAMSASKEKKEETKEEKPPAKSDAPPSASGTSKVESPTPTAAKEGSEAPPVFTPTGPETTTGQPYRLLLAVTPQTMPVIAPICFLLLVVLWFVPWVGVYAGETRLAEQSGFGVAFGLVSHHEQVTPLDSVGMSFYMFLNFLLVILGVLASLGVLLAQYAPPQWRQRMGKVGPLLVEWRTQLLCLLTLLAFLSIALLLFAPLPFEAEVRGKRAQQLQKEGLKIKFEDSLKMKIDANAGPVPTDLLETQWLRRTDWFTLAFFLNLLAFLGALADWHRVRHPNRPLPHMEIIWGEPT